MYAKALAEAGFVVAAFDASFQGASGGTPRFIEEVDEQAARYVAAMEAAI